MTTDDRRLAVFLDFENLAIGARDQLHRPFDYRPVVDALAARGRTVLRRAYADWSYFADERRQLARHHVELIEIPQKMGHSRKNAADIKMALDALELAYTRDFVDTFVVGTGDSDLSPLVHKLRELDKQVIGVGIRQSTSKLLPPACDEFLFYDDLVGDDVPTPDGEERAVDLDELVVTTLTSLDRSTAGPVRGSELKRAMLRRDPTFSESMHGFRSWGELLRTLDERNLIELDRSASSSNPTVGLPSEGDNEAAAFRVLVVAVAEHADGKGWAPLSRLKDAIREDDPSFNERNLGYRSFLEFCRAAAARGVVELDRDGDQRRVRATGR